MAALGSSTTISIFSGEKYDYYSIMMKKHSMSLDLYNVVES